MKSKQQPRIAKVTPSDPAWEAMKGARRNLNPDEGVQEVIFLQRRFQLLWSDQEAEPGIDLNLILKTLTQKRIAFALTGAHGLAAWTGRARATKDVDLLVKIGRNHGRAVNALRALYPHLEVRQFPGLTAFFPPGETDSVIDVCNPHRADIEETLANAIWTESKKQGLRYRIPALEEAIANKYGAMLTPTRALYKRIIDMADFTLMVQHSADSGQKPIDRQRLQALGEKVWPGGGGEEILRLVDQVKAGKAIDLESLGRATRR